jgi:hypothetical protein
VSFLFFSTGSATPVEVLVMRCSILWDGYEEKIEVLWIPRTGENIWFISNGRYMTGTVSNVSHCFDETPHRVMISLDDDSVEDSGSIEDPSA